MGAMEFLQQLASVPSGGEQHYLRENIRKVHANDVLCGRGGVANQHVGNIAWRMMVAENQHAYLILSRREKTKMSTRIVNEIRNQDPPGRFLKRNADTGLWFDIGDKEARKKTSQALREGAPDRRLREQEKQPMATSDTIESSIVGKDYLNDNAENEKIGLDVEDLLSHMLEQEEEDVEASEGAVAAARIGCDDHESVESYNNMVHPLELENISLGMCSMSLKSGTTGAEMSTSIDPSMKSVAEMSTSIDPSMKSSGGLLSLGSGQSVASKDISCGSLPLNTKDMLNLILDG